MVMLEGVEVRVLQTEDLHWLHVLNERESREYSVVIGGSRNRR